MPLSNASLICSQHLADDGSPVAAVTIVGGNALCRPHAEEALGVGPEMPEVEVSDDSPFRRSR